MLNSIIASLTFVFPSPITTIIAGSLPFLIASVVALAQTSLFKVKDLLTSLKDDLPPNVRLLGWTRPEEIWAVSDIALLTSDNEAQPISLIEAGLAGLPAVAENVGSVSEVIDENVTGFLVSSLEERFRAIRTLTENKDLRIQMGNSAKEYCENRFGRKQFLDSHLEAYELAVKKRGLRP